MESYLHKTYIQIDQLIPGVKQALKDWEENDGTEETLSYINDFCKIQSGKSLKDKIPFIKSLKNLTRNQKFINVHRNKTLMDYIERRKKYNNNFNISYCNFSRSFIKDFLPMVNDSLIYIKESSKQMVKNYSIMKMNFNEFFEFGLYYTYDELKQERYYEKTFKDAFKKNMMKFTSSDDFIFVKSEKSNLFFKYDIELSNNDVRNDFSIKIKGNLYNDILTRFNGLNINILDKEMITQEG